MLYDYSYPHFLSYADKINSIQCDFQDSVKPLTKYIVITRLQEKMYAELIGAMSDSYLTPCPPFYCQPLIFKD